MDVLPPSILTDEQVAAARASSACRSARTAYGGQAYALRPTGLALVASVVVLSVIADVVR